MSVIQKGRQPYGATHKEVHTMTNTYEDHIRTLQAHGARIETRTVAWS